MAEQRIDLERQTNFPTIGTSGLITSANLDLYVRAVDGDDANSGTSVGAPLETLQAAVDKIPYIIAHRVIVHVGPHTGSGYAPFEMGERILRAPIFVIGDGAGSGDGFTEIVSSTAALAGSDQFEVKASGLSATEYGGFGAHFGRTIEILTGAAAGDRRTIRKNTTTGYLPTVRFSAAVSPGDTYRIVEPAIKILGVWFVGELNIKGVGNGPGIAKNFSENSSDKYLFLVNFKGPDADYMTFNVANSSVALFGWQFDKGGYLWGHQSTFKSGIQNWYYALGLGDEGVPAAVTYFGAPGNFSWMGWGCSARWDDASSVFSIAECRFDGVIVAGSLAVVRRARVFYQFGSLQGSGVTVDHHLARLDMSADIEQIDVGGSRTTDGLMINAGSAFLSGWGAGGRGLKLHGETNACKVRGGSKLEIYCLASGDVTLDATSGHGIICTQGGLVEVIDQLPAVNASGGKEFSEDNGATSRLISALTSGAVFANLNHGKVFRR